MVDRVNVRSQVLVGPGRSDRNARDPTMLAEVGSHGLVASSQVKARYVRLAGQTQPCGCAAVLPQAERSVGRFGRTLFGLDVVRDASLPNHSNPCRAIPVRMSARPAVRSDFSGHIEVESISP